VPVGGHARNITSNSGGAAPLQQLRAHHRSHSFNTTTIAISSSAQKNNC
jgi:hypothetical protein